MIKTLLDAIKKDRETFYNYRTHEKTSYYKYMIIYALISCVFNCFYDINADEISLLLSVYSILVGFSFSVMFFLADRKESVKDEKEVKHIDMTASLEDKVLKEKVSTLRKELFSNVVIFNYASLLLIFFLIVLFFVIESCVFIQFSLIRKYIILTIGTFCVFCVLFTLSSFFRIMNRITYYFNKTQAQ